MTNSATLIRSLLVYAIVLPLALVVGYALATPTDLTTWVLLALVLMVLTAPFLLKYHRPTLFLFWNTTAVVFFLPGKPQIWFVMAFLSLGIIILERSLSRESRLLRVPSLIWPLIFIGLVTLITAKLRGGFGLAMFGGEVAGGRRYFFMFAAIAGFIAMVSAAIPPAKAGFYTGLFFLGPLMNAVGGLVNYIPTSFTWIFWMFPPDALPGESEGGLISRAYGTTLAAMGAALFLLARYGVKGLLFSGRPLRLLFFGLASIVLLFGGYRTFFLLLALAAFLSAFYEGLFTSKYAVGVVLTMILGAALLVPVAHKLPLPVQRALSVLPLDVSKEVRENTRGSNEWRLRMWETLLPEVPQYVWLGKGLAIDVNDFVLTRELTFGNVERAYEGAKMVGDFHNGPLTVIINFGIWGAIGWLWFLAASFRALYKNFKYGNPYLRNVNILLLGYFCARVLIFFLIFGSFQTDLAIFAGIVGFNVALNGGIAKPPTAQESIQLQQEETAQAA